MVEGINNPKFGTLEHRVMLEETQRQVQEEQWEQTIEGMDELDVMNLLRGPRGLEKQRALAGGLLPPDKEAFAQWLAERLKKMEIQKANDVYLEAIKRRGQ